MSWVLNPQLHPSVIERFGWVSLIVCGLGVVM